MQVMYQRVQEKPKSPKLLNPDLPPWLVRIIMRCLETDPANRYQNGYEILADLQSSLHPSGTGVSRRGSTVQIQIPEFANRKWVWAVAGCVILLILAFAIAPVRRLITGEKVSSGTSGGGGIPALSSGRYIAVLSFQILGDPTQFGYVRSGHSGSALHKAFSAERCA
jgi:serine/threonine protein kinase